jgi:hypothetical protein
MEGRLGPVQVLGNAMAAPRTRTFLYGLLRLGPSYMACSKRLEFLWVCSRALPDVPALKAFPALPARLALPTLPSCFTFGQASQQTDLKHAPWMLPRQPPRETQESPRHLIKYLQDSIKTAQRKPQDALRQPQDSPRQPQNALRQPKDSPIQPQ